MKRINVMLLNSRNTVHFWEPLSQVGESALGDTAEMYSQLLAGRRQEKKHAGVEAVPAQQHGAFQVLCWS